VAAHVSDQRPRNIVAANAAMLIRRSMMTLVPWKECLLLDFEVYDTVRYSGHM
jgi:hypothetical protein